MTPPKEKTLDNGIDWDKLNMEAIALLEAVGYESKEESISYIPDNLDKAADYDSPDECIPYKDDGIDMTKVDMEAVDDHDSSEIDMEAVDYDDIPPEEVMSDDEIRKAEEKCLKEWMHKIARNAKPACEAV